MLPEFDSDDDIDLAGLITHNGVEYEAGDLVAVIRSLDTDGVYEIPAGGDWVRLYRWNDELNEDGTTEPPAISDGSDLLDRGSSITITDGYEAPAIYIVVGATALSS